MNRGTQTKLCPAIWKSSHSSHSRPSVSASWVSWYAPVLCACVPRAQTHHTPQGLASCLEGSAAPHLVYIPRQRSDRVQISRPGTAYIGRGSQGGVCEWMGVMGMHRVHFERSAQGSRGPIGERIGCSRARMSCTHTPWPTDK